jgi:hypothetical protein
MDGNECIHQCAAHTRGSVACEWENDEIQDSLASASIGSQPAVNAQVYSDAGGYLVCDELAACLGTHSPG